VPGEPGAGTSTRTSGPGASASPARAASPCRCATRHLRLYDADADREAVFADVGQLAAALPDLEQSHRGFSASYRRILDSTLQLDTAELAEHQRQLAAQDDAFAAGD
jgi:hypothetical protein